VGWGSWDGYGARSEASGFREGDGGGGGGGGGWDLGAGRGGVGGTRTEE